MSFGIVLSGGGAKGIAHIGVLKALEENNLIPHSIAGTSIGAIIGGLYAIGYNSKRLENTLKYFSRNYPMFLDPCYPQYVSSIFQLLTHSTITMSGLIRGNKIEKYLNQLTHKKHLKDVNIPFIAPCVDILTSKTIAYTNLRNNLPDLENTKWQTNAYLSEVMRASSSLPVIFYPKKLNNYLLIDGGLSNNLPVNLLFASGEKNILAVDLSQKYKKPKHTGIFELTMHSIEIMQQNIKRNSNENKKEKFLLTLNFTEEIDLMDFRNTSKLINIGYAATNDVMPQLKLIFQGKNEGYLNR